MINKTKKVFLSIFLSFITSTSLTLIVVSTVLYVQFVNLALYYIQSSEKESLSQVSYSATFMSDSAQHLALQIFTDPLAGKLLHYTEIENTELMAGINQLQSIMLVNPLVHSIYLYNDRSGAYYISSPDVINSVQSPTSFFDQEAKGMIEDFKRYDLHTPVPRLVPTITSNSTKLARVYTFLHHDASLKSQKIDSAVIVNVSDTWMQDTIRAMEGYVPYNTLIINAEGQLITGSSHETVTDDFSKKAFIQRILETNDKSGYFVAEVSAEKSLVIHASFEGSDWIFVRIIPYDQIVDKISDMSRKTLITGIVILLGGLIVSFVLSRRLYTPIDRMLKKAEQGRRSGAYYRRQEQLKQLMRGTNVLKPPDKGEGDDDEQGWLLAMEGKELHPVLLRLDHYEEFCRQYSLRDRDLLIYSIMNIAQELWSSLGTAHAVYMEEDRIIVIIACSRNELSADAESLHERLRMLQETVSQYVKLSVSLTLGPLCSACNQLSDVYDDMIAASQDRLLLGHRCLIDMNVSTYREGNESSLQRAEYSYPADKERELTEALLLGKPDDAYRICKTIVQDAVTVSYAAAELTITQLACAVYKCGEHKYRNGDTHVPRTHDFISRVTRMETITDILVSFETYFLAFEQQQEQQKQHKYDALLAEVSRIIEEQFSDPQLTLDRIAEAVDLSPAYLGRLYKKLNGSTLSDIIMVHRLHYAKKLLLDSDATITDIAVSAGFLNSTYFYKVFKKHNGVTPNEYRSLAFKKI